MKAVAQSLRPIRGGHPGTRRSIAALPLVLCLILALMPRAALAQKAPAQKAMAQKAMSSSPESPLAARLDAVIDRAVAEKRLVGAVVLVAEDGRVVYHRAAGLADREANKPMREDAIFRLSSLSKPLVSALVMRLVQDSRLRLTDPVTRWLPGFRPLLPDGSRPVIRLSQLLNHTSGLSYRFNAPKGYAYDRLNVSDGLDQPGLSLVENLGRLGQTTLLFPPGASWHYSLGLDVLGAVAATAVAESLPQAMRAMITEPLNLADTGFTVTDPARLAAPYADGKPAPTRMTENMALPLLGGAVIFSPGRVLNPASYPSGGAGMVGTAGDYLKFLETIRTGGGPILRPETVALMMTDQVGFQAQSQGPGWGFGYGWAVLDDPSAANTPQAKGTIAWGGVYGHSWFVDPVRKITVVALTNTAFEGMNGRFPTEVRDAVYGTAGL